MKKESLLASGRGLNRRYSRPRRVGDIVNEMFRSNSPLAMGYRKFHANIENSAEKGGEL